MTTSTSTFFAAVVLSSCVALGNAADFLKKAQQLTSFEAEKTLFAELAGNVSQHRLAEFEALLRPTYDAMPKVEDGHLGHQAVRYVLHRMFVQRHSWYISGLEPSDDAPPPYLQGEWVPEYLLGMLERRLGESGINLHELAALAATLEDLIHKEEVGNLETVYELHRVPASNRIDGTVARNILSTYMMFYLRGGNYTFLAPDEVEDEKEWFATNYTDWPLVEKWLDDIEGRRFNTSSKRAISFESMTRAVGDISEGFGSFNDRECRSLKSTLLQIEDRSAGRVLLTDFYHKGLYSHWEFNEKIGYLRTVGALDESDPNQTRVIVPNYVSSRTNCLEASGLYEVCCRNECEGLMGHLERMIAAPMAETARVIDLVSALSSDTVTAPRNLSATLLARLGEIAAGSGGQVPLHGRLFAQWMHHAFPRECPYPHEAGSVSPQTPDEWMKETGDETVRLSEEEMLLHTSNVTNISRTMSISAAGLLEGEDDDVLELPWSDVEELFVSQPLLKARAAKQSSLAAPSLKWGVGFGLLLSIGYVSEQRLRGDGSSPKPSRQLFDKPESCRV